MTVFTSIWRYFALPRLVAVDALGDASREQVQAQRQAAQTRLDAAVSLWERGYFIAAVAQANDARATLAALGDAYPALGIKPALGEDASPALESVTLTAQGALLPRGAYAFYKDIRRVEPILEQLRVALLRPQDRAFGRMRRTLVLLLPLLALAGIRHLITKPPTMATSASAVWGASADHELAVDHSAATNWLLPDRTTGWIELRFPSQNVRHVSLLNVQGFPAYGTTEARVELYDGRTLAWARTVELARSVGSSVAESVQLPQPTRATRLRVHVLAYHSLGGGFAEVSLR
ncbi:MAG: hypothetical protein Q8Q09_04815 [Deltaproteobacteria bacterium]|nr:hypothetical protein [Deltaproteobacteria bacterium]